MNIWARRTYFLFSVLAFAVIATGLVFYASGWRYDFSTRTVGLVGALSVDSEPSNANVYIDGSLLKDKTPLSANDLVADQYRLSIWKEGYYDWQQNIEINKSSTTFIDKVYLIRQQSLDQYYINASISYQAVSNNGRFMAMQSVDGEFLVYDLSEAQILDQQELSGSVDKITWNQNDTSLLIKTGDVFYLYNLSEKTFIDLNQEFGLNATKYFWVADQANYIIAAEQNKYYKINKFQQTIQTMDLPGVPVYSAKDIYFCQTEESGVLYAYDLEKDLLSETNIAGTGQPSELTFERMIDGFLPIINRGDNQGYFYDFENQRFSAMDQPLESIDFISPDNLLYVNNHEIWQIDNQKDEKNLILRTAENIDSAYWLINNQYVIYITDSNQIKINEINRPENNIYTIDHDLINELVRGQNDNTFYLINDQGIYKLDF